jgi:hypothetical protein
MIPKINDNDMEEPLPPQKRCGDAPTEKGMSARMGINSLSTTIKRLLVYYIKTHWRVIVLL